MTRRVITGNNAGKTAKGLWVSKPGQDVFTADIMNLAFSSDAKNPKVVSQGVVTITPANGYRTKDNGRPGIRKTTSIPYGKTINPFPVVFVVASASDWVIPLVGFSTKTASYLNNTWHSPIYEDMGGSSPTALDSTYGTSIWKASDAGSGDANAVSQIWCCCAVYPKASADKLEIVTACSTNITVKYLVLNYN